MRKKVAVKNITTLYGHDNSVYGLTGDDSGYIYSADGNGMIVQWDLSKPKDGLLLAKLDSSVYTIKLDLFTGYLVIGHNYEGIHILDPKTKEEIQKIKLFNWKAIFDINISENYIYVAAQNGVLYVIEKATNKVVEHKLSDKSLRSITLGKDRIIVGASDENIYVLDYSFNVIKVLSEANKSVFGVLELDKKLVSVSRDCHLRIYDEDLVLNHDVVAHMYAVNSIEKAPEENYMATASQDKTIKIWESETGQLLKVIMKVGMKGIQTQ